jgi:hypothetical protein
LKSGTLQWTRAHFTSGYIQLPLYLVRRTNIKNRHNTRIKLRSAISLRIIPKCNTSLIDYYAVQCFLSVDTHSGLSLMPVPVARGSYSNIIRNEIADRNLITLHQCTGGTPGSMFNPLLMRCPIANGTTLYYNGSPMLQPTLNRAPATMWKNRSEHAVEKGGATERGK